MLSPLDPRCPFDNVMSLHIYTTYVKGILGQGGGGGEGEAPKNKLKDANFTNIIFSVFRTHAQNEDSTHLNLKSTSILNT